MRISIQLYTGKKDNKGGPERLLNIIDKITGPSLKTFDLKKIYKAIHATDDPAEKEVLQANYDKHKGELPAVTWSGTFAEATVIKGTENVQAFLKGKITWTDVLSKKIYFERTRSNEQLKEYSGLICLDIDKLDNAEMMRIFNLLQTLPFVYIIFTSPSGAGLKVIVRLSTGPGEHKAAFLALEKLFSNYNITIDKSGKDINRLCFLCHDAGIYYNAKAATFTPPAAELIIEKPVQTKKLTKPQQTELQAAGEDLYSVQVFTEKIMQYTEGNRNNFVHLFACNANRKGFSLIDCLGFCEGTFSDLAASEIKATVNSAYQQNSNEHGKFKKGSKKISTTVGKTASQFSSPSIPGKSSTDAVSFTPFWRKYTIKKGKGEESYDKEILELRRVDFSKFLLNNGFHLLRTGKTGYQMCRSGGGVIRPVDPHDVKQYVLDWCKQNNHEDVEEMLRKGQKQYFAANELDSLPYKKIDLKRDTQHESYFYFANCWVSVSAEGIKTHEYTDLTQCIWEGNKVEREFTLETQPLENENGDIDVKAMKCEFAKFLYLISYNPKCPDEKDFDPETINERFFCFATSYGFLLDGYKHPSIRKGIFAVDHRIGETKDDQNGRTGKSIIPKAASFLKVTATINGKSFKPDYQFKYEQITRDTQIVNFNDMPANYNVENEFELIADDYSVIRRANGFVDFKYEDSPKPYFSMNGTPRGEGSSYRARMHIIEASDYFSDTYSPYDEFGHSLFSDWDDAEWNRFFNFSLQCVQVLKTVGLVKYPKSNFDMRKLQNQVVPEFIDFMDATENCPRNERLEKISLLQKYNDTVHFSLYSQKLKPHTFHKWVKMYAKNRQLNFNPHKAGSFDKSNGKEYYVLGDTDFSADKLNTNHTTDLFTPIK